MKRLSLVLYLAALIMACGRPDAVNTREEMNRSVQGRVPLFQPDLADSSVYGVYRGILPEEEGEAVYKLSLYEDDTYVLKKQCTASPEMICEYKGDFKYDKESNSIRFKIDGKISRFEIGENILNLLDDQGNTLQVPIHQTAYLTKSELQLANTIWQFISVADTLLSEELQKNTFLRFLPDGSISYNLACNSCRGSYISKVKGEIMFKGGICTKMFCDIPYEDQFNRLMGSIRYFEIKGEQLMLNDREHKTLVLLKSPF